ncbi:MAG: TatD family deoxyribonuclease [Candidatus Thorarchaeota archaeon]|nr:TatD family deoxyribonuclease [Candidatus Thorarchaeota archaeon]
MQIVDTQCHIEQDEFAADLEQVVQRAKKEDVAVISSAISKETWERVIRISREFDNVYPSLGLDPVDYSSREELPLAIERYKNEIVAIGEIGLDHYRERDHKLREEQEAVFRNLIRHALSMNLPIQIHSRSAGRKAVEILSSESATQVHLHAFDGKASIARAASRDLGYYFSIPTSVVRSSQKRKLVKAVDIERLLVETDSPVLGPEIGGRNEPRNVWIALREIASILGRDVEEMRVIILENTLRIYRKIVP